MTLFFFPPFENYWMFIFFVANGNFQIIRWHYMHANERKVGPWPVWLPAVAQRCPLFACDSCFACLFAFSLKRRTIRACLYFAMRRVLMKIGSCSEVCTNLLLSNWLGRPEMGTKLAVLDDATRVGTFFMRFERNIRRRFFLARRYSSALLRLCKSWW